MNNKSKILFVVGDLVGGIRKHIFDIIRTMYLNYDFYLISSYIEDEVAKSVEIDNYLVLHKKFIIGKKPSYRDFVNICKICKFIKRNHIQLIHGHGAKGGVYARIAGKISGVKVIYTPHGGVAHNMFSPFEEHIYRVVEKYLVRFTDFFLYESGYTRDAYLKKIPLAHSSPSLINFNGVDPGSLINSDSDNSILPDGVNIGFFGMLRYEKGILFSLSVIEKLIKNSKNKIYYHIFGDGSLRYQVEDFIQEKGLDTNIFLYGETNRPYSFMKSMDIIFLPSFFESFGYVAVESMILKKTLVVSDAGGLKEVCFPDNTFIFKAKSFDCCLEALKKAVDSYDSEENIRQIDKAYVFSINRYTIDLMCKNLDYVYSEIIGGDGLSGVRFR